MGVLALLILVLIITSFTGIDAYRSFWGNTERMSGVISLIHFAAAAVILLGVFKTEKEWQAYFGIAVLVGVLEFFYVLLQYFGASFVWMPGAQIGTIGNADLLGSFTIFNAFFALYLWRNNLKSDFKNFPKSDFGWFWAAAFFMNIGTLYFAGSRGAMLGFVSGIFIYALANVWRKPETLKIWGIVGGVLVFSYLILFLARNTSFVANNYQLGRITRISIQDRTIQQRFTEWGIAWDAFKAKPIFGYGPNNYLQLHNEFLNPRVYTLEETNFDRAHNAYLDYASMSGILGLAAYILFIAVLFLAFWSAGLYTWASLVSAYAAQSFFVFDSPATYITLFFTVAFAAYAESSSKPQVASSKQPMVFSSQAILAISIFYFLFSIFLIYQVSVKPAGANLNFVKGFNGIEAGLAPQTAFAMYQKSLEIETLGSSEFRNQYTNWFQKSLGQFKPEERIALLEFGITQLEKEVEIHPVVFSYMNLGYFYSFAGRNIQNDGLKKEFFAKAAAAYDKALELSPGRLEVYYSYLQLSFDTKNHAQGVEIMKRAAAAAPDYPKNHWYLGFAYINAGNDLAAVESINKALARWYRNIVRIENGRLEYDTEKMIQGKFAIAPKAEILGAVNPYVRLRMWPELLALYLSAAAADPNDVKIHQSLALVYQNLGLADKTLAELKIIDELSKQK